VTARQRYASELATLADDAVLAYLTERSGLPGPRANLELLGAFGDVAPASLVVRLADDEDEYLRCCGTAALGRLWLEAPDEAVAATPGDSVAATPDEAASATPGEAAGAPAGRPTRAVLEATLTERARDSSWRVREGAAMAGQRIGAVSPEGLAGLVGRWLEAGDPLVARAAIAAVCEPPILRRSPLLRAVALDACASATSLLRAVPAERRRDPGVRTLRQGLGYCWSVAVAAAPEAGLPRFLALAAAPDPDVAWVVAENRTKTRLRSVLDG
jgi:hypothetical protein